VAGHLQIGNHVVVAAKSGVMNNIPDGERWLGIPARPASQMKRQMIALERLPALVRKVAELEKELEGLRAASQAAESTLLAKQQP
jgi:UDP-3-O-[3-hydroxymyristoyl] glucosamine N-acyltransferase